ncbi:MAG: hypothetical protein R2867_32110 [Caldilineaceae bacterium]
MVGGWWFGRLLRRIDWATAWQRRGLADWGDTGVDSRLASLFGATPSIDRSPMPWRAMSNVFWH